MAILTWDQTGDRLYETGTKNGVLYPWSEAEGTVGSDDYKAAGYNYGYAWNGLTAVTESPDGAEETALYADDVKYLSMRSAEDFGFTIEAYTYPDEWAQCDGSAALSGIPGVMVGQQKRKMFGFSFVTVVGNDTDNNDYAEKLHLIYGATASPSERSYESINDSPDAITLSWECSTTPIDMPGGLKKSAEITIDTSKFNNPPTGYTKAQLLANYAKLKEALYGTATTDAYLPQPSEVASIMSAEAAG